MLSDSERNIVVRNRRRPATVITAADRTGACGRHPPRLALSTRGGERPSSGAATAARSKEAEKPAAHRTHDAAGAKDERIPVVQRPPLNRYEGAAAERLALQAFCLLLFNLNELIYVD